MPLKIKAAWHTKRLKDYNLPYDSQYGRIKGRLGEPCLNFKSRLLTSFCRLAQFSPRRKFTELPFADEKFELVFQSRSRRRPRPRNPYFTTPVLSSAGPSSHFHVAACFVPPSYLCNGCTTGHGSRQRNVFQARSSRPLNAGSSLLEDSCPVQTRLKFNRKKIAKSIIQDRECSCR